jgi:2-polyprenyl-3-methyl-5-hydroxy-6-metoxy-1,4-benzoquinol methylase
MTDNIIDYHSIMENYSAEEHEKKAEDYFSTISDRTYLITKPFYTFNGAGSLLGNFAALIEASNLFLGCDVLDFATGSGWTARLMAQMGCNVLGVDVSPTALDIAREATSSYPLRGSVGSLNFGLKNVLDDEIFTEKFDRIIIMDAFHHVFDQIDALKLFFRVLKPGGNLVMSEPGGRHSLTAPAQAEMRQYGVLERDFIVEEVDRIAQSVGFEPIQCGFYSPIPVFTDLRNFKNIFTKHGKQVSKSVENYMTNHNIVRIVKPGKEILDSRRGKNLSYALKVVSDDQYLNLEIVNTGTATWVPSGKAPGAVNIGISLVSEEEVISKIGAAFFNISDRPVASKEKVSVKILWSELPAHRGKLEIDIVALGVCWISNLGSSPIRIRKPSSDTVS